MIGNFQDGAMPGKMQFGSGLVVPGPEGGIEWQLNALSNSAYCAASSAC